MMRVLLDTNIVLDVLLRRMPWQIEAESILSTVREGRLVCVVASLTVTNVFYVARRLVGLERARNIVRECLQTLEILDVGRRELEIADSFPGSDFEDNLQIAVAITEGVDAIVTRDAAGFLKSPVTVLTPSELLTALNSSRS